MSPRPDTRQLMPPIDPPPMMCYCGIRRQRPGGQACKPCEKNWEESFPPRRKRPAAPAPDASPAPTPSAHGRATLVNPTPKEIRARREELAWSKPRMAREAGVSISSVHNVEKGQSVRERTLLAIVSALNRGEV